MLGFHFVTIILSVHTFALPTERASNEICENKNILFEDFLFSIFFFIANNWQDALFNDIEVLKKFYQKPLKRVSRFNGKADAKYRWPNNTIPYWVNMTFLSKFVSIFEAL